MLHSSKKEIFLIRHGESLGNIGLSVDPNPGLSPNGRAQSLKCGEYLSKNLLTCKCNPHQSIILSSPFLRCIQTSLLISEQLAIPVRLEPLLHEWISSELFSAGVPKMPSLYQIAKTNGIIGDFDDGPWLPNKHEEKDDLLLRAFKFRNAITSKDAGYCSFEILICVSHWAMIEALLKVLCKVSVSEVRNCSISRIIYEKSQFICEFSNNYSFLL